MTSANLSELSTGVAGWMEVLSAAGLLKCDQWSNFQIGRKLSDSSLAELNRFVGTIYIETMRFLYANE